MARYLAPFVVFLFSTLPAWNGANGQGVRPLAAVGSGVTQDVEGGNTAFVGIAADSGCSELSASILPDLVYVPIGGGLAFSQGTTPRPGTPQWSLEDFARLNVQGDTLLSVRCAGEKVLLGTNLALSWVSKRDFSSGSFTASSGLGLGVTGIVSIDATRVLIGIRSSFTSPSPTLVCDTSTLTCSPSGAGFTFAQDDAKALYRSKGGPILAWMRSNGLWRSADGGATWTKTGSGLPTGALLTSFFDVGNSVFLGGSSGLYRSDDQGGSWNAVLGFTFLAFPYAYGASGNTLFAAANPSLTSADTVIYSSTNGGASWTLSTSGMTASTVNSIAASANAIWLATNAGVFRSLDGGSSWAPYNTGLYSTHIPKLASGDSAVFAATPGESNGVFRTTDHGKSWTAGGATLANANIVALAASGSTALAASAGSFFVPGKLFRSTDSGTTWSTVTTSGLTSGSYPTALLALGGAFYAGLSTGGVFRSLDAGSTWTPYGMGLPTSAVMVLSGSGNVLAAAVGLGQNTLYFNLGGGPWTARSPIAGTAPATINALTFSGSVLFACTKGYVLPGPPVVYSNGIFASTDNGATWKRVTGLPDDVQCYDAGLGGCGFLAATSRGAFVSTDNGSTWAAVPGAQARALSVLSAGGTVYVGTSGNGVFAGPCPPIAQRLVPIVLDVDTGSAHFTTDLALANRGTTDAQVSMLYTASLGSGTGTTADTLRAGSQLAIPDVLAYLRGKGLSIPTGGQQAGTLLVTFNGISDPAAVAAVARTTAGTSAPQPGGSAGLAYSGMDPALGSTASLTVYGLRQTATDRSNLAIYNTTPDPVILRITAHSGEGTGTASIVSAAEMLPAYGWKQFNRVLDAVGTASGWVVVERTSATGAFGAYGVINDNITNDGSFVVPFAGTIAPLYVNVPVLVETPAFLSELVLTNSSISSGDYVLTYQESLSPAGGTGGSVALTLPATTQRIIPNAIEFLRSMGVAIGPRGAANYAGSLNVSVSSGSAPGQIYAGARTASQSPAGGQYGLFTAGVTPGGEAASVAYIYGLKADADNRTNVAAANTAATAAEGPVTLLFEAFDGDTGGVVRGSQSVPLAPGQWQQLGGFLGGAGVKNGWVRITRTSGTAPWIAYGVVNDGGGPGQRTGDGAYVPMERP